MRRPFLYLLGGVLLAVPAGAASGAAPDPKGVEFFEKKIRPVLVEHCYKCHSKDADKIRGGLILDTREGTLKGGDNGPAVVPGKIQDSLILNAMRHEDFKMPPKGKLSDAILADFVRWVEMGAPDPRDGTVRKPLTPAEAGKHWAFQPVKKPAAPVVKKANWVRDDIDRFILSKLEAEGLEPIADADALTLFRRIHLDLIGMLPSVEELDAFTQKVSAGQTRQAIAETIDRLLASPRFGERWGRYWLDIARYAESNGNADNTPFPEAFRYRDYVIRSFNADKPYDRFIAEQLAGDLLPAKDKQEEDDNRIATGFLALGSKPRAQNNPDFAMDVVADQIEVTCSSIMGLTVACARCHDHKFDPIPTKEYYSLAGIFSSTQTLYGASGRGRRATAGGLVSLSTGDKAMGAQEGRPADTYVCERGESRNRGPTVQRGFITVATVGTPPAITARQSGRLELAKWLTSPEHPLTSRVMANRIWYHLFGVGIVPTVDNFGTMGESPSHPELLDHLAVRFVANGWSVKKMIREIMLSRAYQMSTDHHAGNFTKDPANRLVWRMNLRRLDAEALRDSVLAASGTIDLKPPEGSLARFGNGGNANNARALMRETNNRAVYLPIIRHAVPEVLTVFDFADASLVVGAREITTVPSQALFLINSPFMVEQSRAAAKRVLVNPALDDAGRVELAYKLILARPPRPVEKDRALGYLKEIGGTEAWPSFCQALLASAEFRYVQ